MYSTVLAHMSLRIRSVYVRIRLTSRKANQQKNSSSCPAESRVIPNPHKKSYSVITLFTIILTRCLSR
jgi:hypothetical protein